MQLTPRVLTGLVLSLSIAGAYAAGRSSAPQQPFVPEPDGEHAWLSGLAGTFDAKVGGMLGESTGTSTTESSLGGLWNVTRFQGEIMGQPYEGLEILGYDPLEKAFVSAWVDSMNPLMTTLEGTYDEASKTLTMKGESVGMDGMRAEMVNTTEFREDGMLFTMSIEGAALMTIDYTRKE